MSFDPALPTDRDKVRLLLGDTDTADEQLTDGQYDFVIAENPGSIYFAAATAARLIARTFTSRASSKRVGPLSISYAAKADEWLAVARELEAEAAKHAPPTPYAGGLSVEEKKADATDSDLVQPRFHRGQFRNPHGGDAYRLDTHDLTDPMG